ncbi:50S ribosomal protein L19 [Candidatus Peregrinibacteria bacterium CG08_land_8_20_14_0_20_41_10]|nr:MAG: 50S ribosomal protein L19 [Candidatus Peregrinibacteria bacterium CG1_02_41_10]PIS32395.1 MAG: 50S ribosomal protein L19 [Candidatus Peregrinibacteria bacterium CG08_land_8_20_14_0_20_41_10]
MLKQLLQAFQKSSLREKSLPLLKPGMTVKVHQKIKEGAKERVQIFEGLLIRKRGNQENLASSFTVRRILEGVGVEKTFPCHTNSVVKVEIVKDSKVRRAKLYYMRNLSGKKARLKSRELEGIVSTTEETKEEVKLKPTLEQEEKIEVVGEEISQKEDKTKES